MAMYFKYDRCEHKHRIYAFPVKNEKDELLGFRPVVSRVPNGGGLVENVSDKYNQLKWAVLSTEKLAREFAIKYFEQLDYDQEDDSDEGFKISISLPSPLPSYYSDFPEALLKDILDKRPAWAHYFAINRSRVGYYFENLPTRDGEIDCWVRSKEIHREAPNRTFEYDSGSKLNSVNGTWGRSLFQFVIS